jgi:hypothetical protein
VLPVSFRAVAVWLALAVLLLVLIVAIAFAAIRGFQLYRDVRRGGSTFSAEMGRISDVSLQIEHQLANAEAASGRLQGATARLATSRAQLDVQLGALQEARAQLRRTFWFIPGI